MIIWNWRRNGEKTTFGTIEWSIIYKRNGCWSAESVLVKRKIIKIKMKQIFIWEY